MKIMHNVPLNDKNWFQTGGPAQYFAQPTTAGEFTQALAFASQEQLRVTLLGQGANVLISDQGITGLVIQPRINHLIIDREQGLVTAGAGLGMQEVIDAALDQGLHGLEDFSGIPGSIGGCVYINIHYFEYLLSDFLVRAHVINRTTGALEVVDKTWFGFGYNESALQRGDYYLVEATFKLSPVSFEQAWYHKGRRDEIVRHRAKRYPLARTCGSFFRNFRDDEPLPLIAGKRVPFVAYYLDKIGVKGALQVGGAVVSYQHANMLVTHEGASSNDVIMLARTMQMRVFESFGVLIEPECQFLGFSDYPLLKPDHVKSARDNFSSTAP
ncbi:UDP-N-acetylmuramate dehydrogenase [Candidatus Babeliales bacterium]|nr:UDP-N-acetylmuramate dehydrogenase [Candidatus Babeliales bacterium]